MSVLITNQSEVARALLSRGGLWRTPLPPCFLTCRVLIRAAALEQCSPGLLWQVAFPQGGGCVAAPPVSQALLGQPLNSQAGKQAFLRMQSEDFLAL